MENIAEEVIQGIFESGLRFEIRGMMEVYSYQNLDGAIRTAEACERLTQENPMFQGWRSVKKPNGGGGSHHHHQHMVNVALYGLLVGTSNTLVVLFLIIFTYNKLQLYN